MFKGYQIKVIFDNFRKKFDRKSIQTKEKNIPRKLLGNKRKGNINDTLLGNQVQINNLNGQYFYIY